MTENELDLLLKEVNRLTECLKIANDQAERFEREYYLTLDRLEDAAERYRAIADNAERWAAEANRVDDLVCAFIAACRVVDAGTGATASDLAEVRLWREHLSK